MPLSIHPFLCWKLVVTSHLFSDLPPVTSPSPTSYGWSSASVSSSMTSLPSTCSSTLPSPVSCLPSVTLTSSSVCSWPWPSGMFAVDMSCGFVLIDAMKGYTLRQQFEHVFQELFVQTTYFDPCSRW
ncbi:hypothetical protein L208DRAFT_1236296 [Tricholoma matsutake]|nr:hypothetical protein L208DRAFT_1297504 [Tricholoma matsutake 945]KAF8239779.1 hypothetical protein L208DRAFT_1236296 [Tricholoma matsutake 945]